MTDMLVKLYRLPELAPEIEKQRQAGITIRRAYGPEKHHATRWIQQHFSKDWVSETELSFAREPLACFIALEGTQILGFAGYDGTYRGVFGPTGVSEAARGRGTGKALLLAVLHDMRAKGYIYAIIGEIGPAEFYQKTVGATIIEGSNPGIFQGLLSE